MDGGRKGPGARIARRQGFGGELFRRPVDLGEKAALLVGLQAQFFDELLRGGHGEWYRWTVDLNFINQIP